MKTVRERQIQLKNRGFNPGPIDGIPGPSTDRAMIAFKKSVGLRPRAFYGKITEAALFGPIEPGSVSKPVYRAGTIPPLAKPFLRRMGWEEHRDRHSLIAWFKKYGKYLGDPRKNPWCAEGQENSCLEMFPDEPVPDNPFWARNWAHWGVDAGGPVIGSVGTIGWSNGSGHVGVVADVRVNSSNVVTHVKLLGCNQGNRIKYSWFPMSTRKGKFIAFRVAPSEKGKKYPAFGGVGSSDGFAATR